MKQPEAPPPVQPPAPMPRVRNLPGELWDSRPFFFTTKGHVVRSAPQGEDAKRLGEIVRLIPRRERRTMTREARRREWRALRAAWKAAHAARWAK